MSYLLNKLSTKQEVDGVIRSTEDLVLVLRFGRDSDLTCMQLDEIVSCHVFSGVKALRTQDISAPSDWCRSVRTVRH